MLSQLPLKYKFWLVNIVSFLGMCGILLAIILINGVEEFSYHYLWVTALMIGLVMAASQLLINHVLHPIL